MATAKLSTPQIEALRKFTPGKPLPSYALRVGASTHDALVRRGLIARSVEPFGPLGHIGTVYRLTDEGKAALAALESDQFITLSIDPAAEGVQGATGVPNYNVGVIIEPDHSEDDTKPLEPVPQPEEGFWITIPTEQPNITITYPDGTPYNPPQPTEDDEMMETWEGKASFAAQMMPMAAREQYQRAYRFERCIKFDGYPAIPDTGDVTVDIAIAAHQSYKARQTPEPLPFIVRVAEKAMRDLLDAFPDSLNDDWLFNNLVVDYRIAKGRYLALQERYALRQAAGARR